MSQKNSNFSQIKFVHRFIFKFNHIPWKTYLLSELQARLDPN